MGSSDPSQQHSRVTLLCCTLVPFTHNRGHLHVSHPAAHSDAEWREHPDRQVRQLEACAKTWIATPLFMGCVLAAAVMGGCRHPRYEAVVLGRPWGTASSLPSIPSGEIERQLQSIWHISIYYEHIQKTHNRSPPPPLAASRHVGKQKMLS